MGVYNREVMTAAPQNEEPNWLDYFSGGVPTGEFFRLTLTDLSSFIERSSKERGINRLNEVCFIGLLSYFEAFCKDHFASILNIEPSLLDRLAEQGQDTTINPSLLVAFGTAWPYKLGFVVSEKFDFGTAKKINALYGAMLQVTPFSKDEARAYEGMLGDRNLLVHHGGTFTASYLRQGKVDADGMRGRAFLDSLIVTADYFDHHLEFITNMAKKILRGTHAALTKYIDETGLKYSYSEERQKAKDSFLWWGIEKI